MMMNKEKRVELLAPAGNLDKLKIAILYGADAVYIGGKSFSLRARASNFSIDDIKEATKFAFEHHAKVYVTMNIVPHDSDLSGLDDYLKELVEAKVNGIITTSIHIINKVLNEYKELEVHLSTQLSISNSATCNYYESLGVKRIVLAREVDVEQIKMIRNKTDIGLEVFIHGGMCSSYSGRCMLSNHMVNRDSNRGGCAHSCRWDYYLNKNNKRCFVKKGYFNIASKDLMGLNHLKKLLDIGVDSLKIEGRMKSEYYIATVVRCYRNFIDDYYNEKDIDYNYYYNEIAKAENRMSSCGFLNGEVTVNEQLYCQDSSPTKEFVGVVLEYNKETKIAKIEQRNYFGVDDELEFFGPNLKNTKLVVKEMKDEDLNDLDVARHPKQIIYIKVNFDVNRYDFIRLSKKK